MVTEVRILFECCWEAKVSKFGKLKLKPKHNPFSIQHFNSMKLNVFPILRERDRAHTNASILPLHQLFGGTHSI